MKKTILILITSVLLPFPDAGAQQITRPDGLKLSAGRIDQIVKKLMDTAEVQGLCLGIIQNNKIAYIKAYGFKNRALNEMNNTSTCFYAASLAKPVFAFMVMQLADEGRIDLDKPLYSYLPKPLPDYPPYKDLAGDPRWKLITARHCLDHTTGFPNWREFNPHENKKLEIFFTPGQRYAYSGEGLYLLQMVVEVITGRPLEELAQERIFKPFGMKRTSFLWKPAFENNFAVGHDLNNDTLPKDRATKANAAGSMETTISDYMLFVQAFMNGKGISRRAKDEMIKPQITINSVHQFPSLNTDTTRENQKIGLSYGLGWGLFKSSYGSSFFKEGHGDGWQHYMIALPEKGFALLIMANSANGESIYKELIASLTGITIPWKWEGYIPYRPTTRLPVEVLKKYTGVYEGRLKAIISLEGGQLKVESETVGLPKTNLYAAKEDRFFLKVMDTDLQFIKGPGGKIEKVLLDDEGEHYELQKTR